MRSILLTLLLAPAVVGAQADTLADSRLKYRYIGPEGNRISTVTGVIGNPSVIYAGAASGGIFKSTDGGIHWAPIFDSQPVASIGALMVAPSDPNVVWAGTGEPFIRSHISLGWGAFKSLDAGKTWTRMGLENTGRIARVVIDPRDPDRVYVAALGHLYGPQAEKGVYRTTDGGKNWEKVLFVNDSSGANELVMDPTNPRVLYATFWQMEIHTWGRTSGGAGSGIWKSTDGGTTWKRLTGNGLPTKPVGKINLTVSKTNPNRIYALIETGDGVPLPDGKQTDRGRLFRSDDAGASWTLVSSDLQMAGRTHYYNRLAVSPDNENEVYFVSAAFSKTLDAGEHIIDPPFSQWPGGDHHEIWIDPTDANRMLVSHDGGVSMSTNRGRTWNQVQLPVAQMYHVTVDNKIPYNVYGNRQDGPSAMGPSNARTGGDSTFPGIVRGMWRTVGGGESGWATPDTVDGNLVWSSASGTGSIGGIVTRFDVRNNVSHMVEVWPENVAGAPADSARYRFVWNAPLTLSAHDH
ncbi:MAG: WD40/YVTN/BNR-like repeat-containing protein, partial [Gemmatimonas sp.]